MGTRIVAMAEHRIADYRENQAYEKESDREVEEIAVFLVMVRFVELVQAAVAAGKLARPVPVLATAHDFDILARFLP